jgi:hydrogenase maturation protease
VLVAGVGNIFLRDDGFGPEVARRLASEPLAFQPGVQVVDYGIRGMHLAYDLLDPVDALVLVDALPPGSGMPGDLRVMQITPEDLTSGSLGLDPHGMDPLTVLARLRSLGGELPMTYLVGCVVADTEEGIGLSSAVEAAVPRAMAQVISLAAQHVSAVAAELTPTDPRR